MLYFGGVFALVCHQFSEMSRCFTAPQEECHTYNMGIAYVLKRLWFNQEIIAFW